jgi:hypothetical protein
VPSSGAGCGANSRGMRRESWSLDSYRFACPYSQEFVGISGENGGLTILDVGCWMLWPRSGLICIRNHAMNMVVLILMEFIDKINI